MPEGSAFGLLVFPFYTSDHHVALMIFMKIIVFLRDMGYLGKLLSNHLATLIPKNLEILRIGKDRLGTDHYQIGHWNLGNNLSLLTAFNYIVFEYSPISRYNHS